MPTPLNSEPHYARAPSPDKLERKAEILAIASAGGHWHQLMLLAPAFPVDIVHYVTTLPGLAEQRLLSRHSIVLDCNQRTPLRALWCALNLAVLILRAKPKLVVSTGAMPGLIALVLGKLLGAQTIWVDSAANAEEMSMSGRHARRFADVWLTQWPEVASATGAQFKGRLL